MAEPCAGGDDGIAYAVLLDVEVKCVEEHAAVRTADAAHVRHRLGRSVEQELLEAVDDLDVEEDAAVLGHLHDLAHASHAPVEVEPLFLAEGQLARPRAVDDAAKLPVAHVAQHLGAALEERDAIAAHGRIGRRDVVAVRKADAIGQLDAGLLGGAP